MSDVDESNFDIDEDTQSNRFLAFTLDKETYGVEIRYVKETIGMQPIIEIPDMPEYVKGIINLRGKIIPVMDMRLRLKKEPKEYNDRTCVIIIDIKNICVGLIVDSVTEVLRVPEENIVQLPQMNNNFDNRFLKKVGKVGNDVKLLLDCEKLLTDDDMEDIEKYYKETK